MWDKLALAFDREFPPKNHLDTVSWGALAADDFSEAKHKRGQPKNAGQFGPGGGGAKAKAPSKQDVAKSVASKVAAKVAEKTAPAAAPSKTAHLPTKIVDGKRVAANGDALPAHVEALKIPPAWTDVTFSPDPKASLQATGKDAKGRRQAVYSDEFSAKQSAAKFARVSELNENIVHISDQNEEARRSDDPKKKAAGDCTRLIMTTGIRPGSEDDTGADKKAYGATTLEGKHVIVDGDKVTLAFVGKKGVSLNLPVTDSETAAMLKERKGAAGDDGQLFDISEKNLLDHVHTLGDGGFKTKDFRTLLGTRTAMSEVGSRAKPTNEKEYKKAVMEVAKAVSAKLGNTPTIALASYINPSCFADWKIAT